MRNSRGDNREQLEMRGRKNGHSGIYRDRCNVDPVAGLDSPQVWVEDVNEWRLRAEFGQSNDRFDR